MAIDPRTPVLIGAGHALNRDGPERGEWRDATSLMAEAAIAAAADAGLGAVPTVDAVRVVATLTWRYGDPGRIVAGLVGCDPAETAVSPLGGNSPQSLVNATALDIAAGRVDAALLTGGEAWRTRSQARRGDVSLDWPTAASSPRVIGSELVMNSAEEQARGLVMPVQVYPMFETAIRAAAGRSPDDHLRRVSELWAGFATVAAANPHAWVQRAPTAQEIRTVSPSNRMIGLPYTKLMNSNNQVDMGAALLMCSAARATALGVPRDRWVFPHSGAEAHEHPLISERWSYAETPAVRLTGEMALRLAGVGIDDIEIVDLYSCFPSAVQLGAASLGLGLDRPLTITGGLSFAGGPWNNYSMHAIATLVGILRDGGPRRGLIWANGGYVTKHAVGIYASEPPAGGFRCGSPQDVVDALPRRALASPADAAGQAVVEAYTVMHGRDGQPETAFVACRLADGRRAWGTSTDAATTTAMCAGEWVGRPVTLAPTGTLHP